MKSKGFCFIMIITMHGSAFTSCHMTSYLTLYNGKFGMPQNSSTKMFLLNRHISYHIQH